MGQFEAWCPPPNQFPEVYNNSSPLQVSQYTSVGVRCNDSITGEKYTA